MFSATRFEPSLVLTLFRLASAGVRLGPRCLRTAARATPTAASGQRAVGYDWQIRRLVFGVSGEYARYDVRDSVSAYSTTPAFYTMTRELDSTLSIHARVGATFANDAWLAYFKTGMNQASIDSSFTTSNAANAFLQREEGRREGVQIGMGIERQVGDFVVGLEYLRTRIDDQDFRVRAERGAAPTTNPFVITNPNGTDFARSDDLFIDNLRVSSTFRF